MAGAAFEWSTRFALSFGADAEVLGPPGARRHLAETVRRALARYEREPRPLGMGG